MLYCKKCKASIAGVHQRCPLCQSELAGEQDGVHIFPDIPTLYRKHMTLFKSMIFASVAAAVICLTINISIPETGWWSLIVIAAICCMWFSLAVAVRKRHNIPKAVLYQVVLVWLLTLVWDYFTGWRGWSVNYVLPGTCVAALIVLAIAARLIELNVGSIVIYFTIAAAFGILPFILFLTGHITVALPSLICSAASVITLAALLIFQWENVISELRRRFHM